MNNIGYAVFGSPKGIAVVSNGLFKDLNLDKALYLNNSHIVLDKGEQVVMIRRIPSNLQNLDRKDALLIVLYEHALQHSENRSGGFVGSAICIKDQMPNAEKIISGLSYLFSKMKKNVDIDSRFKAIDSTNWNIVLPDVNKEFGMFEDNRLTYTPISHSANNLFVKLTNIEKETIGLLSNFVLNSSYHSVDYLYASTSNNVVNKLKTNNGFSKIESSEMFNYDKHLKIYKDQIVKDNEQLQFIKNTAATLQNKIAVNDNEFNRLELKIASRKAELNRIESEILSSKTQLDQIRNNSLKLSRKSSFNERDNLKNDDKIISQEDVHNYEALKKTVSTASRRIEDHTSFDLLPFSSLNSDEKNRNIVEYYFDQLPQRKSKIRKVRIGIYAALSLLILTFIVLLVFKTLELEKSKDKVHQFEEKNILDTRKIENENKQKKLFLEKLVKFQKGSNASNHNEFKILADLLLKNYLNDSSSSEELKFIREHKWEFWEFDYTNNELVSKLNPNSKPYFITLPNEINKPLTTYLIWQGSDKIDELLNQYKEEPNHIYKYVNSEVLKDSKIMHRHFKWLISLENGKLEDLKEGKKIKLPFLKL